MISINSQQNFTGSFALLRHALTAVVILGEKRETGMVLTRILLGTAADTFLAAQRHGQHNHPDFTSVLRVLEDCLNGRYIDLKTLPRKYGALTPFQVAVLEAAKRIPYGVVVSYTTLATMIGRPKAVRAVGSALSRNPFPLLIPCHRVIGKRGNSGGYCGYQQGRNVRLKEQLLQMERRTV